MALGCWLKEGCLGVTAGATIFTVEPVPAFLLAFDDFSCCRSALLFPMLECGAAAGSSSTIRPSSSPTSDEENTGCATGDDSCAEFGLIAGFCAVLAADSVAFAEIVS